MITSKIKTLILFCAVLLAPLMLVPAMVEAQANPDDKSNLVAEKSDCKETNINESNCAILGYLNTFINALSALVGVIVVAMIILGGIQYSAAGDDPSKIAEAKKKITNALLALAVFIFTYAFLQWIVPGGIF